jgi:hypothetical protein
MNAFSVAKQSTLLTNSVYHAYIFNGTIIANFFQGVKAFGFNDWRFQTLLEDYCPGRIYNNYKPFTLCYGHGT